MKNLKITYSLVAVFLSLTILGSCDYDHTTTHTKDLTLNTKTESLSGNYLAGRFAQHQQDWDTAQKYMNLVSTQDVGNKAILEKAFLLNIGSGKFTEAKKNALKIYTDTNSELRELATIFLTCDAINNANYAEALKDIELISNKGFGQFTKPLLKTWALVGLGRADEAKKFLKDNSFNPDPNYHIHAGLIEELSGNDDAALAHYKVAMNNGLELHTALIVANFFERKGQKDVANNIYENLDKLYPYKPFMRSAKIKRDFTNITSPRKGAALAMFDLTAILYNNRAYDSAKIYGSIVEMLEHNTSSLTKIMMGDIEAVYNRYDDALKYYKSVASNSPAYWLTKTRISEVYELQKDFDKSIEVLKEMAQDTNIRAEVMASLGDLYRRNNDFNSAITAYDEALENVSSSNSQEWAILYARGMAKDEKQEWASAEKDLLAALKIQPQNPHILNYIAYSWAEKGINLDKALDFAKKAVTLKPYDGSILDSCGWILFKQGKYNEAANMLEEAIEVLPDDAVILDHLGDAYWKTGREVEARQTWKKASNSSSDKAFQNITLQKIKYGIITADELKKQSAQLSK